MPLDNEPEPEVRDSFGECYTVSEFLAEWHRRNITEYDGVAAWGTKQGAFVGAKWNIDPDDIIRLVEVMPQQATHVWWFNK